MLTAYSWQSLVSGPHPDGHGRPEKVENNPPKHPKQLLFQQLCPKNQSLVMSGLRSSRNLSAPPTVVRAGNPGLHPCFGTLGVKRNPTVPKTWGVAIQFANSQGGVVVGLYIRILGCLYHLKQAFKTLGAFGTPNNACKASGARVTINLCIAYFTVS